MRVAWTLALVAGGKRLEQSVRIDVSSAASECLPRTAAAAAREAPSCTVSRASVRDAVRKADRSFHAVACHFVRDIGFDGLGGRDVVIPPNAITFEDPGGATAV